MNTTPGTPTLACGTPPSVPSPPAVVGPKLSMSAPCVNRPGAIGGNGTYTNVHTSRPWLPEPTVTLRLTTVSIFRREAKMGFGPTSVSSGSAHSEA
jgi:hypothetical protein